MLRTFLVKSVIVFRNRSVTYIHTRSHQEKAFFKGFLCADPVDPPGFNSLNIAQRLALPWKSLQIKHFPPEI